MPAKSRVVDPVAVQRRTLGVLSGGVALSGLGITVGITVGGLLAREVAGTDTAAGLGQTAARGAADQAVGSGQQFGTGPARRGAVLMDNGRRGNGLSGGQTFDKL